MSQLFAVFESVKERDLIATPSLMADGIFGLPLSDTSPAGQWAAMVTFERMAFPFASARGYPPLN